jgi:2,3-bisphosphoglycerate-dependent phosphoglycerate mutase
MVPYWESEIRESLRKHDQILVAAHGNSLRAVIKHVKGISDQDIVSLNLPTGIPYVFEFDDDLNFIKDYFLGDPETIKKLMDEVANQGKSKK